MPRIFYVIIFLILTIAPFPLIWATESILGLNKQTQTTNTTKETTTTYNSGYHSHHHYGGFFYAGSNGRGGWLGKSYKDLNTGSSRSYRGGSSSFGGGGFGSFGK